MVYDLCRDPQQINLVFGSAQIRGGQCIISTAGAGKNTVNIANNVFE